MNTPREELERRVRGALGMLNNPDVPVEYAVKDVVERVVKYESVLRTLEAFPDSPQSAALVKEALT